MPCEQCGGLLVEDEDADFSADENGRFKETYECVNCGAKMYVTGNENELPKNWNRYGSAYE